MIGNDVVCFATAKRESNWRRSNYLNKIFSLDEQHYILNAEDADSALWTLWSAKEAVYKIINRRTGIRLYNPIKFGCKVTASNKIIVVFDGVAYLVKSCSTDSYVHSVAVSIADENLFENFVTIQRNQIIKIGGIPFYRSSDNQIRCASVSHHGNYYFAVGIKF